MLALSSEEFVRNTLPTIIGKCKRLTAIFATYNEVCGYPNGPVNTGKSGLDIIVQNGNMKEDTMYEVILGLQAEFAGNRQLADTTLQAVIKKGYAAQKRVERKFGKPNKYAANGKMLAVIYAGLTVFEKAMEFAKNLRRYHENIEIVIVTCDCDLKRKMARLTQDTADGKVDHIVVTPRCGGGYTLREILEGLVTVWP